MAKKSSGTMGILAILGLGAGGVAAYLLLKGQGGEPLHGALGDPLTCWDGQIIYQSIYDRNVHQWLPYQSEADCLIEPADGSPDPASAVTCENNADGIMDKAGPNNESVVYTRVWDALNNTYVNDPTAICEYMDGTLSNPTNCPSGGVYYPLIYSRLSHSWLPYETLANCSTPVVSCSSPTGAVGDTYCNGTVSNICNNVSGVGVWQPGGGLDCGGGVVNCTDPVTASGTNDVCRYGTYQDCYNGVWTDTGETCGGGLVPTVVIQTAPSQPAITVLQGTNITCTYQLLDDMGYPLPGKTMRIYIDNGSSSFAGPLITDSNGMVSWTFPMTWGTYQIWEFDARFAGDTTYAASKSPYLNVTVTTVPPVGCTDPTGNLNDEICDAGVNKICTSSGWALGGTACPPPTTYDFTVYTDGTTFYGTSATYAFNTSGTAQAVISATTLKATQSWTMGHIPITVEIQPGNYPITGNVWLLSNIDVFGVGPTTVLSGTGVINIGSGVSDTSFGNLTLDGVALVVAPDTSNINVHDITYPTSTAVDMHLSIGGLDVTQAPTYSTVDFDGWLTNDGIPIPGGVVTLTITRPASCGVTTPYVVLMACDANGHFGDTWYLACPGTFTFSVTYDGGGVNEPCATLVTINAT